MEIKYCQYCGSLIGTCDCEAKLEAELKAEHDAGIPAVIEKLKEVLEDETYIDKQDGDEIGYEIFVNYDEYISDSSLAKISRSESPMETMDEILEEWRFNAEDYYYPELLKTIEKEMDEYDEYYEEITTWIQEHVYWYLPDKVTKQEVNVVIALDVGNCDSDFTEDNILNYYGTSGGYNPDHEISPTSSIRFLSEQQGRMNEVEEAINQFFNETIEKVDLSKYSKYTKSVIQELENISSHMSTIIFLCKMELKDFINLKSMINKENELNKSYYYDERKGTKEITISKEAMCGLYDIWGGGGSVLEIELEKDVTLPIKAIFDAWIDCRGCKANGRGYDVDDVYGLCDSAWSGEVTGIEAA